MPQPPADLVSPHDAIPPFILALDLGSSSCRALLLDARARLIGGVEGAVKRSFQMDNTGAAEDDAERAILDQSRAIDLALERAGGLADRIAAVGMACYAGSLLGVDENGAAVTPVYTYADARAHREAVEIRQALGPEGEAAVYDRVGCPRHSAYAPARRMWIRRHRPEEFARAALWRDVASHVYAEWFGSIEAPCSYSYAAWLGLLDSRRLEWDAEGGGDRALGMPEWRLPPLSDCDEPLRGLAPRYAQRWPALADKPFFPAVGDGAAANLGAGGTSPETLILTVGTTGALRIVVPGEPPVPPRGLWRYRVDRRHSLLGGATTEGGSVFAWMIDTLRLEPKGLEDRLAAIEPDSHGLTILPFFSGERSPGWVAEARAAIAGLTQATTPEQIARASLESVAYRFAAIAELMKDSLGRATRVVACGGAMQSSALWRQIAADAMGRPVAVSLSPEATSRGVALLALRALGEIPDWSAIEPPLGEALAPDARRGAIYAAARQRQADLYKTLIG